MQCSAVTQCRVRCSCRVQCSVVLCCHDLLISLISSFFCVESHAQLSRDGCIISTGVFDIFLFCFFSETPPLSVSHSTARLTHASSCGVAIQTIPSSARPRKGRPSTAPCVGMERYRFHYEQRSGGPFLFLMSVFSDLLGHFQRQFL